jgi:hypothetical protein
MTAPNLSPRRTEVLALVLLGCSRKEMSARTGLSVRTINTTLHATYAAIGLPGGRGQKKADRIVPYAAERGWVRLDDFGEVAEVLFRWEHLKKQKHRPRPTQICGVCDSPGHNRRKCPLLAKQLDERVPELPPADPPEKRLDIELPDGSKYQPEPKAPEGKLLPLRPPALEVLPDRPKTRADCIDGPRPCPWVGCRHHLYLDVSPATGAIKQNHPGEPDEMAETCSLDVADQGGITLDQIGQLVGLTRERVRQIETRACDLLRRRADRNPVLKEAS